MACGWSASLAGLIGREHSAGGLDDQTVRRGAMLGPVALDGLQTPDPEVLGEAVRVHGVEGPVGPVLTLPDNRHEG
jgi:hypothetical protein